MHCWHPCAHATSPLLSRGQVWHPPGGALGSGCAPCTRHGSCNGGGTSVDSSTCCTWHLAMAQIYMHAFAPYNAPVVTQTPNQHNAPFPPSRQPAPMPQGGGCGTLLLCYWARKPPPKATKISISGRDRCVYVAPLQAYYPLALTLRNR